MDALNLIQDLAIVLLAAGLAGVICRRVGLSVIVGYLVAGIIVGPYTPPFSFVQDIARIQTLSQIGLVFLMFSIGLGLSLSKLGRMGWPTLLATGLGAFLMFNFTGVLGKLVGWTPAQTLFIAAMFMVSSSAVIAKIVGELNLGHERAAQLALGITVLEDVVAVVMLTILAAQTGGEGANVGKLLGGMTAFVVLLVGAGLLVVPRLMHRLETRADPELQTIIVAGVLFLLAIAAARAGYSLALGAFLLGAIVAEIPQKGSVERAFGGMRDLFSSVFFVSIGMMIEVRLLVQVWPLILGLGVFALVGRAFATGLALILCGARPREARRAGLLLGPLGEFSFIIAQLGVSAAVLPESYYPLSVGVSIFTVLAVPVINRFAEPILNGLERLEPRWARRAIEAYHSWLDQVKATGTPSVARKFIRGRLIQIAVEALFVTGVLIFSRQLIDAAVPPLAEAFAVSPQALGYAFWGLIAIVVLVPLFAIWRNISTVALIVAESLGRKTEMPSTVVQGGIKALGAIVMGYWLYAILPTDELGVWGWIAVALATIVVLAVFSNRLIYWHSRWQSSVQDVLAETPAAAGEAERESARRQREQDLQSWDVHLGECVVPDGASYAGQPLTQLAIPARFGCAVLELERNGIVITAIRPDLGLYPGDKLLLLGQPQQIKEACAFLTKERRVRDESAEFRGSVLETFGIPEVAWQGRTLAELRLAQLTGVRVVGIRRGEQRIIAPAGDERLHRGDNVLVAGTLAEIGAFRRWLKAAEAGRGNSATPPPA
ncbi:MAG TPA: cation:proton antiporter [Opitutaceae bacterium]